ncbi:MAG: hypothetical protein BGO25_13040 [Acidobacteriales bacterium 59-55]|nr:MAG: hypothetical protein BGO25_13040 [Acidobacteriales bacterium 59-55]
MIFGIGSTEPFGKAELNGVALIIADLIGIARDDHETGDAISTIMEYISAILHRNYFFETKFKKSCILLIPGDIGSFTNFMEVVQWLRKK